MPPRLAADIVVVHFTMSWAKLPYLIALRARCATRAIVIVEHSYTAEFESLYVTQPKRFRTMLRLAYALADRVVSVSYGQAAWLRRAELLKACKLAVIQPFTDCAALLDTPLPAAAPGPLRLGAYGRYCAQKGFDTLIMAMQLIAPDTATLELRGFGPDGDALKAQAIALPHVKVGGKLGDLKGYLSSVDAVVVPSRHEAYGQVALEARMAGRPVIVTAVGGLPEQVDAATGLIIPAEDPAALASVIAALADAKNHGQLPALGADARQSAARHIEGSSHRWLMLFNDLVTPARGRFARIRAAARVERAATPVA